MSITKEIKQKLSELAQYAYCDCGDSKEPGALLAIMEGPYTIVELRKGGDGEETWDIAAQQRFDFTPRNPTYIRRCRVYHEPVVAMNDTRGTPRAVFETVFKVTSLLLEPLVVKPISAPERLRFDVCIMKRSRLPFSLEEPQCYRMEEVRIYASPTGEYTCMEDACFSVEKALAQGRTPYCRVALPKLGSFSSLKKFYADYKVIY
ncbi:hypothetical protein [Thiolapillus sp.]|uniref:hypothetical protein n=1 Tax=Thiolapillus sp. TaxID=2017437 RepID=UPI003AF806AD